MSVNQDGRFVSVSTFHFSKSSSLVTPFFSVGWLVCWLVGCKS